MSWRSYTFTCPCGHAYSDIVEGEDGRPDPCPACGGADALKDAVCAPRVCKVWVPTYPGYQRATAGYGAEARRPAEKKGRQVGYRK